MGYSFALVRGRSRSTIKEVRVEDMPRGTIVRYMRGPFVGECDLEIAISYNHSWYFHTTIPQERHLESLYGMKGKDALPILENAIRALDGMIEEERKTKRVLSQFFGKGNAYDEDKANADPIWYVSALNAKRALVDFKALCEIAPHFTVAAYLED